ncbi:MAG: D-glycero-beta-D-manno-heptose-7-phosphate kinase [Ignavibacteria bacterium]|nr:D-glycero-beta-D-manno-heptose-7-phosphate kinase [Ignavibacteria bacterium]
MSLTVQQVRDLEQRFSGKQIAIVGDLMIDRYFWGNVTRVSPEAPVPVVDVTSESARLGGAANVAHNIRSLGGEPLLVGLIGDDHAGTVLTGLMKEQGLSHAGIITDETRRTTAKARVIAHDQHVVRIDYETKAPCGARAEDAMISAVAERIGSLDAIILEDYNKGVMTRRVIREVVEAAKKHDVPVTVDPKFDNFLEYRDVTVFKPNRRETEEVLGGRLETMNDILTAGGKMLADLKAQSVLLTRGPDGMSLFESNGQVTHFGTTASRVKDVSGAGDTVIATLTMGLVAGLTIAQASELANYAGGVVVGSVGIVPISLEGLVDAVDPAPRARGR